MVKVGIAALGSRGDIEPHVALGHALSVAGHEVTVAAPISASEMVTSAKLNFVPIDLDVQALMRSEEGQRWLATGNMREFLNGTARVFHDAHPSISAAVLALAEKNELLISAVNIDDYASAAAEVYGLRLILGYPIPWVPTSDWPNILVTQARLRPQVLARPVNRITQQLAQRVYWRGKRANANAFRRSLGLPPASESMVTLSQRLGTTVLHAYSPTLVTRPRDWGSHNVMTGFWRLSPEVRALLGESDPPPGLTEWLAAGPAPVFLGFGSMPIVDPARFVDMVTRVVRRTGMRVLIGAGWTDYARDTATDQIHVVGAVNHEWLFPQCRAVVHHGGAGTTAAGLLASRPTWIYSLFADQPFWGARIARLGLGGHTRFVDLTEDRLTEAFRRLADEGVRARAAAVGEQLRGEDGVAGAVREIHRVAT